MRRSSPRRLSAALVALVNVAAVATAGRSATPIIEGRAAAVYDFDAGRSVPSYHNQGFAQDSANGRVAVVVAATGGWTRATFPSRPLLEPGNDVAVFARTAVAGRRTRADAVAGVLQAIASDIRYVDEGEAPEEPAAVLARREARCVGLANLAVAALQSLSIEARIARGMRIDGRSGAAVPHRWIEVFYPDAGWVFSDPTESVNYVSARHVLLTPPADPDPEYNPSWFAGPGPRVAGVSDGLLTVDVRPGSAGPLGERVAWPARFGAAIVGAVVPPADGQIRLLGQGRQWTVRPTTGGAFSFPGLAPGQYQIVGEFAQGRTTMTLRVGDAERANVSVPLP